jgi:hypothetical protein
VRQGKAEGGVLTGEAVGRGMFGGSNCSKKLMFCQKNHNQKTHNYLIINKLKKITIKINKVKQWQKKFKH